MGGFVADLTTAEENAIVARTAKSSEWGVYVRAEARKHAMICRGDSSEAMVELVMLLEHAKTNLRDVTKLFVSELPERD